MAALGQASPAAAQSRFEFRAPAPVVYLIEQPAAGALAQAASNDCVTARLVNGSTNQVQLGSRVVLQLENGKALPQVLQGSPLRLDRTITENLFILQAPDVWTALREAERLAQRPAVLAAYPVARRQLRKAGPYAAQPNDSYFGQQWYLENRNTNGFSLGADLNVRAAWPVSRGQGVPIAVADDGVDLAHPEFSVRAAGMPHRNFDSLTTNGSPTSVNANHGTAVAGLAVAQGGNGRGISGVAPLANLVSLVIYRSDDSSVDEEAMMNMYQYRLDLIAVHSHSWVSSAGFLSGPSLLEQTAISNAVNNGRSGRGMIIVHASGNGRSYGDNVNDDGYLSDPRIITAGAVRADGVVTEYSNPGACLLVAAPSSGAGFASVVTTDRLGTKGYNTGIYTNDAADYATDFGGTSSAAPQIGGLVALLLATNPRLTYRDVQQVLLLSARHYDLADPHAQINGAGLRVSPNVGFGVPDAGVAVQLARRWTNRPPLATVRFTNNTVTQIIEEGMRVEISGQQVPTNLLSLRSLAAALGPRADKPTASLPLVYVGLALEPLTNNLSGRAALIQRGENYFSDKIAYAAQAGAAFAIIFNNTGGTELITMDVPDAIPIPAVFISLDDGVALRDLLQTNNTINAQLWLNAASYNFNVTQPMLCEYLGVRLRTDHPRRGEVRLTLQSPAGTVSVLQRVGPDNLPGPADWMYYSTHHFYESSYGTWTVQVSDEIAGYAGNVLGVEMLVRGVTLADANHDGLDDTWELERLQTAQADPKADPDGDGYSNIKEFILGTEPLAPNEPLQLDLSFFNAATTRLSWPGNTNQQYTVYAGSNLAQPLALFTNLAGRFPVTELCVPRLNTNASFYRVQALPAP